MIFIIFFAKGVGSKAYFVHLQFEHKEFEFFWGFGHPLPRENFVIIT